jgi:sortase A
MRPDDPHTKRSTTPLIPQRPVVQSPPSHQREAHTHVAAAAVARTQLDQIYSGNTHTPTPQTTPVPTKDTPGETAAAQTIPETYDRTHTPAATHTQADQWKQYHSAWQDYYQKYYERYYVGQVHHARQALEERASAAASAATPQPARTDTTSREPETLSQDEALYDLRHQLLGKIKNTTQKVRQSRHFVPISAAICIMVLFLFLQYNRVLFANVQAYVSPGNIDPANIIVDPTTEIIVSPEPKLIIPKINVDVPVVYDTTPDNASQQKAMESGVAWFGIPGANSKPGQVGNTVLSGHSSNDIIDQGNYKFIFARLDRLDQGDSIFVNYQSKRYTYTVTKKEVVTPTEVSKLVYPTDKPIITLITCTPIGTATNRLLITAEQVSPNPTDAASAPSSDANASADMPGNSSTFVERLFGES